MELLIKIIVCFIAGAGAGIGTGFAGMSAAAVIGPMLITFLDMPAYTAVGVGLASDVLASALSAWTYKKNGNIDIRHGLIMMVCVLVCTTIGSYIATFFPDDALGDFSIFMMALLGLKFIFFPVLTTRESMEAIPARRRLIQSVVGGVVIGLICGFAGAGGGMMMLLVLTTLLGYELKTAVGTSVFIMTFSALTGAVSHFTMGGLPDLTVLVLCVLFTLLWAKISAVIANRSEPKLLNRITGVILLTIGLVIIAVNLLA